MIPNSSGPAAPRNASGSNFCTAMLATSPTGPLRRDSPAIGTDGVMKPPALSLPDGALPPPNSSFGGAPTISAQTSPLLAAAPKPLSFAV